MPFEVESPAAVDRLEGEALRHYEHRPEQSPADPRIADVRSFHKTDLGNSELLANWHGDELRYCPVWSTWLVWDGTRWRIDDTGAVYRLAAETVRELYSLAGKIDDSEERKSVATHAFKCESKARLDAMVALAATNAALVIQPESVPIVVEGLGRRCKQASYYAALDPVALAGLRMASSIHRSL